MFCQIIDNIRINHRKEIKHLFSKCSKILMASPFISDEGIGFLKKCGPEKFEKVTLVTTLKAKNGINLKRFPSLLNETSINVCY